MNRIKQRTSFRQLLKDILYIIQYFTVIEKSTNSDGCPKNFDT